MFKYVLKKIQKYDKIIIHRHSKPDGDALGSQLGLKEILKINFPEKLVYAIGDSSEFEETPLKNIFKSSFEKVNEKKYNNSLVIVLDSANISRIEGEEFFRGNEVIKIDHHKTNEEYGDLEWVESDASSTCELISRFARKNKLKVNKKSADYLLTGIITDSGRFSFSSVSYRTFQEASFLLEKGAKPQKIVNALNDRDINFIRIQGHILSNLEFKNKVSWYMMPKGLHKKFNVNYDTASQLIFLLMSFKEVEYAVYASFDEKNSVWKASLRSKKRAINKLAQEYGGGGHEMASGFTFKNKKEFPLIVKKLMVMANEKS
ncbi:MAG: putative bifunctional oligoribonuclease and PAP phosphatase NrnA [Candidatus Tyloplasma litorale]|nr:MAG: putative bifunctional oligoribonuclease and PAP phosphatase NrnA [Mycoplasmatales bacterium]